MRLARHSLSKRRGLSWCHSEKRKVCLEDVGIEPTAFRMQSGRSTTELNSHVQCSRNLRHLLTHQDCRGLISAASRVNHQGSIAQWQQRCPSKTEVPGSNPGGAFFQLSRHCEWGYFISSSAAPTLSSQLSPSLSSIGPVHLILKIKREDRESDPGYDGHNVMFYL